MAAPAFRAVGSSGNTTGTTSQVVTLPTHQADDILVVSVSAYQYPTLSSTAPTISISSGWTLVRTDADGNTTFNTRTSTWWRKATSASETNPTITLNVSCRVNCSATSFSGADGTSPIDADNFGSSATTVTAITANAVTTLGADRLLVFLTGMSSDRNLTPPSGMTERLENLNGTAGPVAYVADVAQATQGSSGNKQGTATGGSTTYVAHLIALKPPQAAVVTEAWGMVQA